MATCSVPMSIPMDDSYDSSVDSLLDEVADAIDHCRELDESSSNDVEIYGMTATQTSSSVTIQELVHGVSQMIQDDTSCGNVESSVTANDSFPKSILPMIMDSSDSDTGCSSLHDQDSDSDSTSDQLSEALDESFEWEIYRLFLPTQQEQEDAQLVSSSTATSATTNVVAGELKSNPKKRTIDKVLSEEAKEFRRQRNREHARRFRLRQKNKTLEQRRLMTIAAAETTTIATVELKPTPPLPSKQSVSDDDDNDDDNNGTHKVLLEESEALRRERNREHARASRLRKKAKALQVQSTTTLDTTKIVEETEEPTPPEQSFSDDKALSDEDEASRRQRQRNRDHARSSRLRKKTLTDDLEHTLTDLKTENETLRTLAYVSRTKEDVDSMLQARVTEGFEKFLTGLKQPENRVLNPETITFLESLRTAMLIQSKTTKKSVSKS